MLGQLCFKVRMIELPSKPKEGDFEPKGVVLELFDGRDEWYVDGSDGVFGMMVASAGLRVDREVGHESVVFPCTV